MLSETATMLKAILHTRSHKDGSCRIWNGSWGGAGYGYITIKGQRVSVRRLAVQLSGRAIGEYQTVVRRVKLCSHVRCINPSHLEVRDRAKGGRSS